MILGNGMKRLSVYTVHPVYVDLSIYTECRCDILSVNFYFQGQGQDQTSQAEVMTHQGQVIGQGQMVISQGQPILAVPNLGQGHTEGQTVVQGQSQVVQGGQNLQVVSQV